jgi:hypothetical protein
MHEGQGIIQRQASNENFFFYPSIFPNVGNIWGTYWEQLGNMSGTNRTILGTCGEHAGTLREHSDNDGNFYEIKILDRIRKSLRVYECMHS